MSTIRLAIVGTSRYLKTTTRTGEVYHEAPTLYLSHAPGAQGDNALIGKKGVKRIPDASRPALLISFVYLKGWLKARGQVAYRDWALDSGAFTAHRSGETIDLRAYTSAAKELLATDPTLKEVMALDVIGDAKASRRNADAMMEAGVPGIPTFHFGSKFDHLLGIARDFPKIALGGCARLRPDSRRGWIRECFARVWPKKIHGFGIIDQRTIMAFPFHSVDASSWELSPMGFGLWKSFGTKHLRWHGSSQNLRSEIEHYLKLERLVRSRWRRDMELLERVEAGRRQENGRQHGG